MDHKVSKDMISSGMIPSGEKTQADLGRTQYGSAPSPSSLMEAYKSIYEHHQKDADGKVIEHGGKEELNEMRVKGGGVSTSLPKKKAYQKVVDKLASVCVTCSTVHKFKPRLAQSAKTKFSDRLAVLAS